MGTSTPFWVAKLPAYGNFNPVLGCKTSRIWELQPRFGLQNFPHVGNPIFYSVLGFPHMVAKLPAYGNFNPVLGCKTSRMWELDSWISPALGIYSRGCVSKSRGFVSNSRAFVSKLRGFVSNSRAFVSKLRGFVSFTHHYKIYNYIMKFGLRIII